MAEATFHTADGATLVVKAEEPLSLMRLALANNVPGIIGECGGNAMCATCHVYVRAGDLDRLPEMEEDEDEMLDGTAAERTGRSRLGCQVVLDDALSGIEVEVPGAQQ